MEQNSFSSTDFVTKVNKKYIICEIKMITKTSLIYLATKI
jgi:hypothetical protein